MKKINFLLFFLLTFLIAGCGSKSESNSSSIQTNSSTQSIENEVLEETTENEEVILSEEEYKELCEELWYKDIFFSEENLKGKNIKILVYVEEQKFFKAESIYDSTTSDFINKYSLKRDLLACGVRRKDEDSYVGGQINLYFSDDFDIDPMECSTGEQYIVYGEIVDYSRNTWDGYNICGVIPRYMEKIE